MIEQHDFADLVAEFKDWGAEQTRRVLELTQAHGVILSSVQYSNGEQG